LSFYRLSSILYDMEAYRLHHTIRGFGIIACTLFSAFSASPVVPPTLGFTVLEASGIDPYDAKVYSQKIRKAIDDAGVYKTLEFSDITMRLAEQELPNSCPDAHSSIVAGQILGAEYFGFGTIGRIGKTYTISMQVVEVRTGRIVSDISEFHNGKQIMFEEKVIPRFARKLSGIETKNETKNGKKK